MACVSKRRGKWVADYRDPSGKRRWITRDTKREAEAALATVKVSINRDEYVAPDTNRTLQMVFDHWWRLCVEGSDNKRGKPAAAGTQGFYLGIWNRYFAMPKDGEPDEPRFGPRRLRSITKGEVADWKETLGKRVGPRTVIGALGLLDTLFRHARRFDWCVTNPCESVHRPKHKAKVRALTPGELAALVAKADANTALLLRCAAVTGVRVSELFGVRFEDIDFESGAVSITRQLQSGVALPLKTEKSRRRVTLPAAVLKDLREHPRRFAGGLVFVAPEGGAWNHSNFHRDVWRPLLKAAGIERQSERGRVTFHSLRHSAATAAIAAGENVQTVASLLGHANPQVTLTVYADAWAAKVEHSAESIAGVLFPESGSKTVAEKTGTEAQSAEVIDLVVGREGLEPSTKRLRVSCSTN